MKWKRTHVKAILSGFLFILFIPVAISSLLLFFNFGTEGGGGGHGGGSGESTSLLLGLTRGTWVALHDYLGLALILVLFIHIILNFSLWLAELKALKRIRQKDE
jgi:hypothetical protein